MEFEVPVYAGLISEFGVALVFGSATVLLATSYFLPEARQDLLLAGVFSLVLAIDDQFLLHDYYLWEYLWVHEKLVYVAYALVGILLLRRRIGKGTLWPHRILFLALAGLGLSVAFDSVLEGAFRGERIVEDLLKLAGWSFWAIYWVDAAGAYMGAGETE